jgi:G6PDH family F420-dependent oxidoreductase
MCEQAGPKQLVRDAVTAESNGFDFAVISDHYMPWLDEQGHSPYAWAVLGAVAQATERLRLMTYVTCPSFRYHPAVIAQKAATMALLSDGRFTLGLGAGERLNEHIIGGGWPSVDERHEMLVEAVEIISELLHGNYVTRRGAHYDVDSAKIWDLPPEPLQIGIAVSGRQSCTIAGQLADVCIAVEAKPELIQMFEEAGGAGKPKVGQVPVSYDVDRAAAVKRAHEQFRWFGLTWKVNSELPGTAGFAAASQFVTPDDVAASIPCGPDVDEHVRVIRKFIDAGYTHIALCQVGADAQAPFLDWYSRELGPALARL